MRVALVEWTQGGHHELHLRTAAGALADWGAEVWIFYPEPAAILEEIKSTCPRVHDRVKAFGLQPHHSLASSTRAQIGYVGRWLTVRNAIQQAERAQGERCDFVFLMYMDEFMVSSVPTSLLDLLFPYPWGGICMQPLYRLQDTLGKRPEFLRRDHFFRSHHFRGAMPLDEGAVDWLEKRFKRPFVPMPEYGDMAEPDLESPIVRDLLKQAGGRAIVGAYGVLAKRKGILTLLRAAAQLEDLPIIFALAGKLASETYSSSELREIEARIADLGSRCFYRPEKIATDSEFSGLVAASSILYIAYVDWVFSSGLQSIAAQFDVSSIVANTGIMGERAEKHKIGLAINPREPAEAAAAIRRLLSEKLPNEGFESYRRQHRIAAFRTDLCRFVQLAARIA